MTVDRPVLGMMLMLGFCALAPAGDAIAKVLGETVPLGQLLLVRFAAQALLVLPLFVFARQTLRIERRILGFVVLRTLIHIVGIGAMFTALRFLPLADAVAIAFVMPFIMLALGRFVLGETVGPRRLTACAVGFIGTLLVIQPSFANVGLAALLPLLVALTFSLFMLVTRHIAKIVDPIGLQAVSGLMATAVLAVILTLPLADDIGILQIVPLTGIDMALLALIGVVGTSAHLLMTWSLRFAPAASLAPMQYLEIPFATLIGWMIFSDLPGGMAALGIVITVAAGLYIVLRERAMAQPVPAET